MINCEIFIQSLEPKLLMFIQKFRYEISTKQGLNCLGLIKKEGVIIDHLF